MSIAVLGAGAFGTALAVALAAKGPVMLWGRDLTWAHSGADWRGAGSTRENPRLPGVALDPAIHLTKDLAEIAAQTVLLSLPAQQLSGFLAGHGAALNRPGRTIVSCAKGIDLQTLTGPSALIARACPDVAVAVLTGPSFAADIARGLPTALTLAAHDPAVAKRLQHALSTRSLRLYRSGDVAGAELGGALKNVIAIAAGAAIGAGLGDSARAAVITRGFAEMSRLAVAMGAQAETLGGLSGLGDLVLTCTSQQSRNFRYGLALGAGQPFDPSTTVEGAATARAVAALAPEMGLDMPVSAVVSGLALGKVDMEQALKILLNRPLKEE